MSELKLPGKWNQVTAKANTKLTKEVVKASLDMSEEVAGKGLCPDCKNQMERIIVNEHPTLTCMGCRISIPISDSQLELEATPELHDSTQMIPVSGPPKDTRTSPTVKQITESLAPLFNPIST